MNIRKIFLLLGIAFIFIFFHWDNPFLKNLEELIKIIDSFGYLSFVVYIIFCIAASFLFVPLSITRIVGIVVFGPLKGSVLNIIGITSGAFFSFVFSRYIFSKFFMEKFENNKNYLKINTAIEKHGAAVLISTRMNPIFSNTAQNFLYGLTSVELLQYTYWTVFLYGIGTVSMALWLELVISRSLFSINNIQQLIFIVVSIAAIAVIFFLLKKKTVGFNKKN